VNTPTSAASDDLRRRLRRIEGQARGVQNMLNDARDCREILQQLKAIEAAAANAKRTFMLAYARECLLHAPDGRDRELLVEQIIGLM